MKTLNIFLSVLLFSGFVLSQDLEYSMQDYNSTSPTYGMDVWYPEYTDYITLHYFSTQGWNGWTNTFGQLSNFQEELRSEGYENVVIIAVGQSVATNFNSNFCANSDLPLVVDVYPNYEIRDLFSGSHKQLVIIDADQNEIGRISLGSGLNSSAENYIRNAIIDNYPEESVLGDINADEIVNIQDIILLINMILGQESSESGDVNFDGNVDILDAVVLVNMILQP